MVEYSCSQGIVMDELEFIKFLINTSRNVVPATEPLDLKLKIEAQVLLNLMANPNSVLGEEELFSYANYEIKEYDVKQRELLFNSALFVDFMFVFKSRLTRLFDLNQLGKLRYILVLIEAREKLLPQVKFKLFETILAIDVLIYEVYERLFNEVDYNVLVFLINAPEVFFDYLEVKKKELFCYSILAINNDFLRILKQLLDTTFNFNEKQLDFFLDIIHLSDDLYDCIMNNVKIDDGDKKLFEELLKIISKERIENFDIELCRSVEEQLQGYDRGLRIK